MGNYIVTAEVYECERHFNNEMQDLKNAINRDQYNNFCNEF